MTEQTVLIGANGQLGSDIRAAYTAAGRQVFAITHADRDVRDHASVAQLIEDLRPRTVINTAAFHKVEACEDDPETAFAVNALAVRHLARLCERAGARLVHISTDYVFGGDAARSMPYEESAPVAPLNVYGVSKAVGEQFVRAECARHLIVRVSGLYGTAGASGKGGNFIETMLRLGRERGTVRVVTDQVFSPTSTAHLAASLLRLDDAGATGTYHVTGQGACSWFDFAHAIFEVYGEPVPVEPATSVEFGTAVRRPGFSVLENRRLSESGFGLLPHWRQGLEEYWQAKMRVAREPLAQAMQEATTP